MRLSPLTTMVSTHRSGSLSFWLYYSIKGCLIKIKYILCAHSYFTIPSLDSLYPHTSLAFPSRIIPPLYLTIAFTGLHRKWSKSSTDLTTFILTFPSCTHLSTYFSLLARPYNIIDLLFVPLNSLLNLVGYGASILAHHPHGRIRLWVPQPLSQLT